MVKKAPEELYNALQKAKNKRDLHSRLLRDYTIDWVISQKKVIELQESIDKLEKMG